MTTVLTIHYQSTTDTHIATIDEPGTLIGVVGGGIGPVKALIGFASHRGAIDFRDIDQWYPARRLGAQGAGSYGGFYGWYSVFIDADGIPVTFAERIETIEVSE